MSVGVDPAVSRAKFDAEIAAFRAREDVFAKRGWWLIEASYPTALVALIAAAAEPPIVVFGALFDFTDYDLVPLSVRLVNPFTRAPLTREQIGKATPMLRRVPNGSPSMGFVQLPGDPTPIPVQQVIQGFQDQEPFVCLPGIREYHDNPAHTGDSWNLHRNTGVGSFINILDQLSRFGADHVSGFGVQWQFGPQLTGVAA